MTIWATRPDGINDCIWFNGAETVRDAFHWRELTNAPRRLFVPRTPFRQTRAWRTLRAVVASWGSMVPLPIRSLLIDREPPSERLPVDEWFRLERERIVVNTMLARVATHRG